MAAIEWSKWNRLFIQYLFNYKISNKIYAFRYIYDAILFQSTLFKYDSNFRSGNFVNFALPADWCGVGFWKMRSIHFCYQNTKKAIYHCLCPLFS